MSVCSVRSSLIKISQKSVSTGNDIKSNQGGVKEGFFKVDDDRIRTNTNNILSKINYNTHLKEKIYFALSGQSEVYITGSSLWSEDPGDIDMLIIPRSDSLLGGNSDSMFTKETFSVNYDLKDVPVDVNTWNSPQEYSFLSVGRTVKQSVMAKLTIQENNICLDQVITAQEKFSEIKGDVEDVFNHYTSAANTCVQNIKLCERLLQLVIKQIQRGNVSLENIRFEEVHLYTDTFLRFKDALKDRIKDINDSQLTKEEKEVLFQDFKKDLEGLTKANKIKGILEFIEKNKQKYLEKYFEQTVFKSCLIKEGEVDKGIFSQSHYVQDLADLKEKIESPNYDTLIYLLDFAEKYLEEKLDDFFDALKTLDLHKECWERFCRVRGGSVSKQILKRYKDFLIKEKEVMNKIHELGSVASLKSSNEDFKLEYSENIEEKSIQELKKRLFQRLVIENKINSVADVNDFNNKIDELVKLYNSYIVKLKGKMEITEEGVKCIFPDNVVKNDHLIKKLEWIKDLNFNFEKLKKMLEEALNNKLPKEKKICKKIKIQKGLPESVIGPRSKESSRDVGTESRRASEASTIRCDISLDTEKHFSNKDRSLDQPLRALAEVLKSYKSKILNQATSFVLLGIIWRLLKKVDKSEVYDKNMAQQGFFIFVTMWARNTTNVIASIMRDFKIQKLKIKGLKIVDEFLKERIASKEIQMKRNHINLFTDKLLKVISQWCESKDQSEQNLLNALAVIKIRDDNKRQVVLKIDDECKKVLLGYCQEFFDNLKNKTLNN